MSNTELSVLERIKLHSQKKLRTPSHFQNVDIKALKKELNHELNRVKPKNHQDFRPYNPKGGRPRKPESEKARDIRVTIKADTYSELEKHLSEAKSRSALINKYLEMGLAFEKLRSNQANILKDMLADFASIFAGIKVKQKNSQWRSSEIRLEDNTFVLSKLYNQSLEISKYLEHIGINELEVLKEYLTDKELVYLGFAKNPAKLASVVTKS
jgi:hypothetical protein